jgi:hypothetical protein
MVIECYRCSWTSTDVELWSQSITSPIITPGLALRFRSYSCLVKVSWSEPLTPFSSKSRPVSDPLVMYGMSFERPPKSKSDTSCFEYGWLMVNSHCHDWLPTGMFLVHLGSFWFLVWTSGTGVDNGLVTMIE